MRRVLVVEDGPAVRSLLAVLLDREGLRPALVEFARDGASALHAVETAPPDAAFVSLHLADGEGDAIIRSVLDANPAAAVVALTTFAADHPSVLRALRSGAGAVLQKPIEARAFQRACQAAGVGAPARSIHVDVLPDAVVPE